MWRSQFHSKLHLTATVTVVAAASLLSVSVAEWCLLILAIGLVWLAEALNTALEFAVDLISPDHHDLAGMAKDTAAGAVLLAAATSAAVGFIILGPKLLSVLAT